MAIFGQTIISFTYAKEGGLSRAKTDKASKNPAPYCYKGICDYHTNKGITWTTFLDSSKKLGFEASANNFFTMPALIWEKIAKIIYWDSIRLNSLKSDAIAWILFSFRWGSGYAWMPRISKYLKTKNIVWTGAYWSSGKLRIATDYKEISDKINLLIEKQGEQKTFDELIEQKRLYLVGLNQPANIEGWLNRLNDLKELGNEEIKKKVKIPTKYIAAIKRINPAYNPYTRNINL